MKAKKAAVTGNKIAWRFAEPPRHLLDHTTDAKLYGAKEPVWPDVATQMSWTKQEMDNNLRTGFNWYNNFADSKKALEWTIEFLHRNPRRKKLVTALRNASPQDLTHTTGFMCRMGRLGYILRPYHLKAIIKSVKALAAKSAKKVEPTEEVTAMPKFNIQDRLNEKFQEALGELEGRFDDFIFKNNYKGNPEAVAVFTSMNIHQQKVKDAIALYERRVKAWTAVGKSTDPQIVEGYIRYGKREIKAIVGWFEKAIADFKSYETVKKVNRKVRTKKAATPEKKVSKLKFLREFAELKLKSIDPTDILTASEVWVYDSKKRKLGLYAADPHVTKLDVKNSTIIGFDSTASVQKRLRKPAEQLKAFEAAGKPAAKKWFKGVRSVETVLKGRITADMILLKAFK